MTAKIEQLMTIHWQMDKTGEYERRPAITESNIRTIVETIDKLIENQNKILEVLDKHSLVEIQ